MLPLLKKHSLLISDLLLLAIFGMALLYPSALPALGVICILFAFTTGAAFIIERHKISIDVEPKESDIYIFHYQVSNSSTWESATRFRKYDENDINKVNKAIIPETGTRGDGIELGGKLVQVFTWSEVVDLSKGGK